MCYWSCSWSWFHVDKCCTLSAISVWHFAQPNIQIYCVTDRKLACISNYREKQSFPWRIVFNISHRAPGSSSSVKLQKWNSDKRSVIHLDIHSTYSQWDCFWAEDCDNFKFSGHHLLSTFYLKFFVVHWKVFAFDNVGSWFFPQCAQGWNVRGLGLCY